MVLTAIPAGSQGYFWGRMSRDQSEKVLQERGMQDGLYLLRESMNAAGDYALSICYQSHVHHYSILRQYDGMVMIPDGQKFVGPVELVQHHSHNLDGLLVKPTLPCELGPTDKRFAYMGVSYLELERLLLKKAKSMKLEGNKLEDALGINRNHFVNMVSRELHKEMLWFHDSIGRDEADQRLSSFGHKDGRFLIRSRDADRSFALTISYNQRPKHYKIAIDQAGKYAIDDGQKFECLMDMVDHYYNKTDGLLVKLSDPVPYPGYVLKELGLDMDGMLSSIYYELPNRREVQSAAATINGGYPSSVVGRPPMPAPGPGPVGPPVRPAPPLPLDVLVPAQSTGTLMSADLDGNDEAEDPANPVLPDVPSGIYDVLPRTEATFNLKKENLQLHKKLGGGCFGDVLRGVYMDPKSKKNIPVAVKTLKREGTNTDESELIKEAKIMAALNHQHIVRMIGVCKANPIMLVLELAPLGPLHRYLKKNLNMSMKNVIKLMYQVAKGMQYLESQKFVHRDLAARNVLLANEHFAKISDFGLSKALGIDNNYYQAKEPGKWPIKWYAPECIHFHKFDIKSDIWSYGVTLWEATSYGQKPYKGMKGTDILAMLNSGDRLAQPEKCPQGIYEIMHKCWQIEKTDRPNFEELVTMMRKFT